MKKGELRYTDPSEMRACETCKETKIVTDFVRGKVTEACVLYRYTCKACANAKKRTGKPPKTRFQKGHSFGKRYQKGHVPWSKGRHGFLAHIRKSESRNAGKALEWKRKVKERDGKKCVKCGSMSRISAHHIVPWKDSVELRFDVSNGMTLCNSCHGKEEGFRKGQGAWNKGKKMPNASWNKGLKGFIPWNKGKSGYSNINKGRKLSEEHKKRLSKPKRRK